MGVGLPYWHPEATDEDRDHSLSAPEEWVAGECRRLLGEEGLDPGRVYVNDLVYLLSDSVLRDEPMVASRDVEYEVRGISPGSVDVVLPEIHTVVFFDGCYWHGHDCDAGESAPYNAGGRDFNVTFHYSHYGWQVVRLWECWGKERWTRALRSAIRFGQMRARDGGYRRYAKWGGFHAPGKEESGEQG